MVDKLVGPEKLAMSESFSVTGRQTEPPDFWSSVSQCDIILLTTVFIYIIILGFLVSDTFKFKGNRNKNLGNYISRTVILGC